MKSLIMDATGAQMVLSLHPMCWGCVLAAAAAQGLGPTYGPLQRVVSLNLFPVISQAVPSNKAMKRPKQMGSSP